MAFVRRSDDDPRVRALGEQVRALFGERLREARMAA